ncbi:MAG: hypothetical protein IVW55_01410 [Chloroflexi bacterium]|nr:hypothetical protein [Chloroflexota bacterium]
MAEGYIGQAGETPSQRYGSWTLGLVMAAVASVAAGLLLATFTDGIARPWAGLAFVVAMGLAIIVGVSKTTSA